MRVFVTGASGWLGSALVPDLQAAGHEVAGLARSDTSARALEAAGVDVHRGSVDDLDVLAAAAAASDGVVHLAFRHDVAFSGDFLGAAESDHRAIETFGEALAGSGRPLVIASGTLVVSPGRLATESDGHDVAEVGDEGMRRRWQNAELTLALAERDVRSSVVRLPPTCHGDGDNGFMAALVATARATGGSGYIGDGANRWPAVHRLDAARAFQRALEVAPAGSTLHAVAEEGVPTRQIAAAIGRGLGLPVVSIPPDEAAAHFTWLARFLAIDGPASSALTRELLDWEPVEPGLLADLDQGHYFREHAAA